MTAVQALNYLSASRSNAFHGVKIHHLNIIVCRLVTASALPILIFEGDVTQDTDQLSEVDFLKLYGEFEFSACLLND